MGRRTAPWFGRSIAWMLLVVLCLVGLAGAAEKIGPGILTREAILTAKILTEERIDVPTGTVTIQGPRYILNAEKDGYIMLFVYFDYANRESDGEVFAVNTKTGTGTKFVVAKPQLLNMILGRGREDERGRFLFIPSSTEIGRLWCYDPAENTLRNMGRPPFEDGRSFGHSMVLVDDKVWCSVDSKGKVGLWHYDLKTDEFRSYGFIITDRKKLGGETHAYRILRKGEYVYLAVGKVPWELYAFHLPTEKCEKILEAPTGNAQIMFRGGYVIRRPDPGDIRNEELYKLSDGKVTLTDEKPVVGKERVRAQKLPPRPKFDKEAIKPTADGTSVIRYQLPGEKEWKTVALKPTIHPGPIRRLVTLSDEQLFGIIGNYRGNFIYNPKTGESVRSAAYKLSAYATIAHGGKVYMSGYPTSPVYVYDPAKPLRKAAGKDERDENANPRLITFLVESWSHKMWGAAAGSDGRIYFCGEVIRKGNGGGLGWWDPKEEKRGGLPMEVFAGHKLYNAVAIQNGDKILFSSHTTLNNFTSKEPESGKVFVYDVKAGKVINDFEPVKGAKMLGPMVEVSPGRIISVALMGSYIRSKEGSVLFGLDVNTMDVSFQKKLPVRLLAVQHGMRGGQEFIKGPDGFIWTYMGESAAPHFITLVRIDPQTAEIKIVGRVVRRGPMAFVGNDLYRGCEHKAGHLKLRKLANIVP